MTAAGDTLTLETTKGPVVIEMNPGVAPGHVAHLKRLVSEGFYDGVVFHRVIDGFMAQTGCPKGNGTGGSKYPDLKAEFNAEPHVRGTVSMARASSPIRPIRSSSSASPTPPFSTESTRSGAGWFRAWRTSTRSSAANPSAIRTRSSRRR